MKKYVKIECVVEAEVADTDEQIVAAMQGLFINVFHAESLTIEVLDATQLVQAQD